MSPGQKRHILGIQVIVKFNMCLMLLVLRLCVFLEKYYLLANDQG